METGEFPLGFGPVTIPPGATVDIVAKVGLAFLGKRLVVTKRAEHAKVMGIKTRGHELVNAQPIPAAAFAPPGAQVSMDVVLPGHEIVLTISSDEGGVFEAVLIGDKIDSLDPLIDEAIKAVREADEAYEPGVTLDELAALS